jgi:hypothetical protein
MHGIAIVGTSFWFGGGDGAWDSSLSQENPNSLWKTPTLI